jgi:hypothetical protein
MPAEGATVGALTVVFGSTGAARVIVDPTAVDHASGTDNCDTPFSEAA